MHVKFAYENIGKTSFGSIYRPVAKVTLHSPNVSKLVDVWMIVDTGADYSIVPRHISEKLRISIERDCFKDVTFGVGGGQTIYFCKKKIIAQIGLFEREIPLAFFDNNEIPPLIGRLGFLETFDTEFLKKHVVVFKE